LRQTTLRDGTLVACLSASEARVLDQHVEGYLELGVTLPPQAVVIDVGANIGLFGVRAVQRFPGVVVHAFEPVPPIFEVLQANALRFAPERLRVWPVGLSDAEGQAVFTYFPNAPALSTAHPEDWSEPGSFESAVRGNLRAAGEAVPLAKFVPGFLAGPLAGFLRRGGTQVEATLWTLSRFLAEQGVERVDLLKVDAEGAELKVLRGVAAADWPRIAQVVVEVHDREGRLAEVQALLQRAGFTRVVVAREPGFEDTRLVNLFATRAP
jgi:FkbM family methyltransferase